MAGYILYDGPSQLDGKTPVVCILTTNSNNVKTGNIFQTWILLQDINPMEAVRKDEDAPICGNCIHRLKRTCYVEVWQAPSNVWKTWKAGKYLRRPDPAGLETLLAGRTIRLGAYGDPAAIPLAIWDQIVPKAKYAFGYTHQWHTADVRLAQYCMASVDNLSERARAKTLGYRTFRVHGLNDERIKHEETKCPGSKEAGKKLTCAECRYCDPRQGTGDVSILIHGRRGQKFLETGISA